MWHAFKYAFAGRTLHTYRESGGAIHCQLLLRWNGGECKKE